MTDQKRSKKFVFGNEKFGGSYTPGEFEINFPEDMSKEDFEKVFTQKMKSLHRRGSDLKDEFFDNDSRRKENLKPLSIRVKPHTKEFFKKHSILSPRDVLEMYEEFNNGSEAFINSLLEEEKELENELAEIQEKLRNAKLFKDKLVDMKPENDVQTDEDKLLKLKQQYERSEVKEIGNETSPNKAKHDIVQNIQMYNTQQVAIYGNEYIILTVYTNAQPVIFYFKNEYSKEDIEDVIGEVEKFCDNEKIAFVKNQNSIFCE